MFLAKQRLRQFFSLTMISKTIYPILVLLLFLTSCSKDEGVDGKASVSGTVAHHETIIPYAIVYIQYGSQGFPGSSPSLYEQSVMADKDGNYIIDDLAKGAYYLYATGYDISISDSVFGGIPINIEKRKEQVNTNVPVTEN